MATSKEPSAWAIFDKLVGLGVDLSVESISLGRSVIKTLRLEFQPDSEQEDAIRSFGEAIHKHHDALVEFTIEILCQAHHEELFDAPFVPDSLTVEARSPRGDPRRMSFKGRRLRSTWEWRKLGTEWRWQKTRQHA